MDPVSSECSSSCGNGVLTVTRCFVWSDTSKTPLCKTEEANCPDLSPCPIEYGACQCTESADPLNLTAQECALNDPANCRPCDTAVCGQFTQPVKGACSVTCGQGQHLVQKCFVWENGQPSTCTQQMEACNDGECLFKCTCTSDDPSNLSAKVCNSLGFLTKNKIKKNSN